MLNRYYIIDNFYNDPDSLVSFISTLDKEKQSGGNYAGLMTEMTFFNNDHVQLFERITCDKVQPGTPLNGKFRFSREDDKFKQNIHFDYGDNLIWAGVIYLSKDHPASVPGTEFWIHNETQLEAIPLTTEGINDHGWKDANDLKNFLETDGMDESKWTKTLSIPYKYNRLVLFRPWMFHSPGKAFGNDFSDCRIIQTFFLKAG
jgi:hypothetical protein